MRWQELWCHHTIVLLAPPSQSHGCIPCAAAAGANEAVAVEARSDVLDRAGRWQSYSQPCGWVLGLGQASLGIQAMKVMIEWGQMGWLMLAHGISQLREILGSRTPKKAHGKTR